MREAQKLSRKNSSPRVTAPVTAIVYGSNGKQVREITLPGEVFSRSVSEGALHQVVVGHMAAMRAGSASTKTRSDVRGGGRKPWRQKGTGRARAGTIRSPLWAGGGTVFGPHPRSYRPRVNRKTRQRALSSGLSERAREGRVLVVDELKLEEGKTREMASVLKSLKVDGRALLVVGEMDEKVKRASSNIPGLEVVRASEVHAYQVVAAERVILTEAAVGALDTRFSATDKG